MLAVTTLLTMGATSLEAQHASDTLMSGYLRASFAAVSRNVTAAVEMMPEEGLRFKPAGVVANEVRTFGEIVLHLVVVNAFSCEMGDGKPATSIPRDSTLPHSKSRLVAVMNEVNARCMSYLATLNDGTLSQVISSGNPPRRMQGGRGNSIIFAIAHANEHYGNLVTYLRAKGMVPPKAAAQRIFLTMDTSKTTPAR